MKIRDIPQSGKLGQDVSSRNQFGQYRSRNVPRKHPRTAAQRGVWGSMKDLSDLWNWIREDQREGWRRLALEVHSRPNLGEYGHLDGRHLFLALNRVLATCQREFLLDAPLVPRFERNPVIGFKISREKGRIVFKLKLAAGTGAEDRPPLGDLMLFGWAPCNAGVAKNTNYAYLGPPPARVGDEIDFTKLYLKKLKEWRKFKKKRYQVPLEGARIFIRVWQQVNGWENKLHRFLGSDFVPRRP